MMAERGGIDDLCIDTIRVLSIDAVEQAASGHPGMPMGTAPMAYVLLFSSKRSTSIHVANTEM